MLGIYELQTILNRYSAYRTDLLKRIRIWFLLKKGVLPAKNIQFFLYNSGSKTCVLFKKIGG
jgi:hypothetical protein